MPIKLTRLTTRMVRPVLIVLVLMGSLCPGAPHFGDDSLPFATVSVRVLPQGDLTKYWKVQHAELRENLQGTWGFVEVENARNTPMQDARFYGEYFDANGKFCLSLVFSLFENEQGRSGSFAAEETRTLRSLAFFLSPAAEPKQLRLYLLEQRPVGGSDQVFNDVTPMRVPLTFNGSIPADQAHLWLGPELAEAKSSIMDLILARVSVDKAGHLESVQILNARDANVESWFQNFASYLSPVPASRGKERVDGVALILVRAVPSPEDLLKSVFLPRALPWVSDYVGQSQAMEIPPVTTLLLQPPPTRIKRFGSTDSIELPPPRPGLFEVPPVASEWSSNIFDWKIDSTSGALTRVWKSPPALPAKE